MAWSLARSRQRIADFSRSVPAVGIAVREFDDAYLNRRRAIIETAMAEGRREQLIFNVGRSEAITVDGVHIYVQLMDFADAMIEQSRETETSHVRALAMLHLHYSGCDRMAEQFDIQRVDFHGPRMHAVVVSPAGPAFSRERAAKAMSFARQLKLAIERAGESIGGGRYRSRVRIGIDSGPAVAVNSGRGSEPEPLFLGSPANYAAKLAEGDDEPGIFISNRVRQDLGIVKFKRDLSEERLTEESAVLDSLLQDPEVRRATDALASVTEGAVDRITRELASAEDLRYLATPGSFRFHHQQPPLSAIKFEQLTASNSIRMPLASVFADIDGFTNYVAECTANKRVPEMVANLHVLRAELAACLREDFGGRKVRFIGDCIHGLVAEGTRTTTDDSATVLSSARAAAGLRSSFELSQEMLPNISDLGLAIGVELGTTPITRLGIRGERSVRCAVSRAVSSSEDLQRKCDGKSTALGPEAMMHAQPSLKRVFGPNGIARALDCDALENFLAPGPAIISSGATSQVARPHSE